MSRFTFISRKEKKLGQECKMLNAPENINEKNGPTPGYGQDLWLWFESIFYKSTFMWLNAKTWFFVFVQLLNIIFCVCDFSPLGMKSSSCCTMLKFLNPFWLFWEVCFKFFCLIYEFLCRICMGHVLAHTSVLYL